ncbi:carboxypeptidase-like regulatory domain-containing protein [Flagellimonas flava]|uniref:Carboxypeptidase regulatory-like domain-containing protein n=1 Tax=Flagellimonas flava TaxID=570519 RepID=A0A1M5MN07_9FLAO|nr:carboxypeptidase-like regulatory domain-containing protein [Allomuricauda flava]SHG78309.1 hypothetical protein SAMN04488116_2522 [Allomuricauda flava]
MNTHEHLMVGELEKYFFRIFLITTVTVALLFGGGCDKSDNPPLAENPGSVSGVVKDEDGNVYPEVEISLIKGDETLNGVTDTQGKFLIKAKFNGSHELKLKVPLSSKVVSGEVVPVTISEGQVSNVDFIIQPQPIEAHLNFGSVQILEEIVDADGNTPTASNERLYAANIFDPPLGKLTAIKAPDDHHVTLSEFRMAKGELMVSCNGSSAQIHIMLEGMIPNGTYTFWLAYLNKTKKVGENIDFVNDFVFRTNPPIGASNGTENIAISDAQGVIDIVLVHSSCILTNQPALVIPVLYHINGKTFGGGHVPDEEEMVHLLVYFQ